jgi:hypothetical protein
MLTGVFDKPKDLRAYPYKNQSLTWLRSYSRLVVLPRPAGSIELGQAPNGFDRHQYFLTAVVSVTERPIRNLSDNRHNEQRH